MHLFPQLPSKDQCVHQVFAILQPCSPGHSSDDFESKSLPDLDGGDVILEYEVKYRIFVPLLMLNWSVATYTGSTGSLPAWAHTPDTSPP